MKVLKRNFRSYLLKKSFYDIKHAQTEHDLIQNLDKHYFYVSLQNLQHTQFKTTLKVPDNPILKNSKNPEINFLKKLYDKDIQINNEELDWSQQPILNQKNFVNQFMADNIQFELQDLTPKQVFQQNSFIQDNIKIYLQNEKNIQNKEDCYYYCMLLLQMGNISPKEKIILDQKIHLLRQLTEVDVFFLYMMIKNFEQCNNYFLFLRQQLQISDNLELQSIEWIFKIGLLTSITDHMLYYKTIRENESLMKNDSLILKVQLFLFDVLSKVKLRHQLKLWHQENIIFDIDFKDYLDIIYSATDLLIYQLNRNHDNRIQEGFFNIWDKYMQSEELQSGKRPQFLSQYLNYFQFECEKNNKANVLDYKNNINLDILIYKIFKDPHQKIQIDFIVKNFQKFNLQKIINQQFQSNQKKFFEYILYTNLVKNNQNQKKDYLNKIRKSLQEQLLVFLLSIELNQVQNSSYLNIILDHYLDVSSQSRKCYLNQDSIINQILNQTKNFLINNNVSIYFSHKIIQLYSIIYGKQLKIKFISKEELQQALKEYYERLYNEHKDDLDEIRLTMQNKICFKPEIDNQYQILIKKLIDYYKEKKISLIEDWTNIYILKQMQFLNDIEEVDKKMIEEIDNDYNCLIIKQNQQTNLQIFQLFNQRKLSKQQIEKINYLIDHQDQLLKTGIKGQKYKQNIPLKHMLSNFHLNYYVNGQYNDKIIYLHLNERNIFIVDKISQHPINEEDLRDKYFISLAQMQQYKIYELSTSTLYHQVTQKNINLKQILRVSFQLKKPFYYLSIYVQSFF